MPGAADSQAQRMQSASGGWIVRGEVHVPQTAPGSAGQVCAGVPVQPGKERRCQQQKGAGRPDKIIHADSIGLRDVKG